MCGIWITKGDEVNMAMVTRYEGFEFLLMPFGLCNAPSTFSILTNDGF